MYERSREAFEAALKAIPEQEIEQRLDQQFYASLRDLLHLYSELRAPGNSAAVAAELSRFTLYAMARTNSFSAASGAPGIQLAREQLAQGLNDANLMRIASRSILFANGPVSEKLRNRQIWPHVVTEIGWENTSLRAGIATGAVKIPAGTPPLQEATMSL